MSPIGKFNTQNILIDLVEKFQAFDRCGFDQSTWSNAMLSMRIALRIRVRLLDLDTAKSA